MGTLLVAAFLAITILSLVFMLFIGLGMSLSVHSRRALWRILVLPVLALLLVWQYTVLIGWPPFLKAEPGNGGLPPNQSVLVGAFNGNVGWH
jgi:hypothetical protein